VEYVEANAGETVVAGVELAGGSAGTAGVGAAGAVGTNGAGAVGTNGAGAVGTNGAGAAYVPGSGTDDAALGTSVDAEPGGKDGAGG
jgi:hypothetical protein